MKQSRSRHSLYLFAITLLLPFFLVAILVCTSLVSLCQRKKSAGKRPQQRFRKSRLHRGSPSKPAAPDMRQAKTLLGADKDFYLYYDENWQKGGEPFYCARIDYTVSDHLLTCENSLLQDR